MIPNPYFLAIPFIYKISFLDILSLMKQNFFGYSAREASRITGIPYVTVWRHANGVQDISVESALLYHERLGIPMVKLLPKLKAYLIDDTVS